MVMCLSMLLLLNGWSQVMEVKISLSTNLWIIGTSREYKRAYSLLPCITEHSRDSKILELKVSIDWYILSLQLLKEDSITRRSRDFPKRILASTSSVIFSIICCTRQLLFTIFIKFRQKSFIIWFQIGSNFFGSGHKLHWKIKFFWFLPTNRTR